MLEIPCARKHLEQQLIKCIWWQESEPLCSTTILEICKYVFIECLSLWGFLTLFYNIQQFSLLIKLSCFCSSTDTSATNKNSWNLKEKEPNYLILDNILIAFSISWVFLWSEMLFVSLLLSKLLLTYMKNLPLIGPRKFSQEKNIMEEAESSRK